MNPHISKTREGAKVPSRNAVYLQYSNTSQPGDGVNGVRPIGGPNVDALLAGVDYPNIQNALDELISIGQIPINGIYVSEENAPPIGSSQIENITFSGTTASPDIFATKVIVNVYGMPFIFDVGITADAVCNEVLAKIQEMIAQNKVFRHVQRQTGTLTPILEVSFIDNAPHEHISDMGGYGISIKREITSNAKPGYGTWTYLGKEDKTLTGGAATAPVTMHYFKRIA